MVGLLCIDMGHAVVAAEGLVHLNTTLLGAMALLWAPWVALGGLLGAVAGRLLRRQRVQAGAGGGLLLLGLGAVVWAFASLPEPDPLPPSTPIQPELHDIVLVLIDTLRADAVQAEVDGTPVAPHLRALAEQGVSFAQAKAASSWTRPATAAIVTGRYPSALGVHKGPVDEGVLTLAELLHAAGYQSLGVSDNYVVSANWGFAQGFEQFSVRNNSLFVRKLLAFGVLPTGAQEWVRRSFRLIYMGGEYVNQQVDRLLVEQRDHSRPLFLYAHYMDPHYPYYVHADRPDNVSNKADPAAFLSYGVLLEQMERKPYVMRLDTPAAQVEAMHTRYLGGVQLVDQWVGELLDRIDLEADLSDAWVIVVADHGEEFLEHGLYGHGHGLYEEQVHVPLIVRPPADWTGERGRVVEDPVGTIQLMSTIADLAGNLATPNRVEPGLTGMLLGRGASPPEVCAEVDRRGGIVHSVQVGSVKAISTRRKGEVRVEAYDLSADPGEAHDISDRPEARKAIRRLEGFDKRLKEERDGPDKADRRSARQAREEKERLEALGYVE